MTFVKSWIAALGLILITALTCSCVRNAPLETQKSTESPASFESTETIPAVTSTATKTTEPPTEGAPTDVIHFGEPGIPKSIKDIFFSDEHHGWVVGTHQDTPSTWAYTLAHSDDGGASWSPLSRPITLRPDPDNQPNIKLFFKDNTNGWLFYSNGPSDSHGLFSTTDGGGTWSEESPKGVIQSIQKTSDNVIWVREWDDRDSHTNILVAPDVPYETWKSIPFQLPEEVVYLYEIVLESETNAWVSHFFPELSVQGREDYNYSIFSTVDGGDTWKELPAPCGPFIQNSPSGVNLSSVGNSILWLGCGTAWGAGSGSKYVFVSEDGGQNWKTMFSTEATDDFPDRFSKGGGYYDELKALTADFAYMSWRRAVSIIMTHDGGRSWQFSRLPCSSETSSAVFISPLIGWAHDHTTGHEQTCINRTSDGGETWDCSLIPSNEPCY